jgi:hypothetical protein
MSALCHKRTSPASLDQLICGGLPWPSYEDRGPRYIGANIWRCLSLRRQPEARCLRTRCRHGLDRGASRLATSPLFYGVGGSKKSLFHLRRTGASLYHWFDSSATNPQFGLPRHKSNSGHN